MLVVYTLAIFTSAFLLFLVQPMFARMVLPLLGGVPSVWNTALVFYQAALLAGYAYAHASSAWLGMRRQSAIHLGLVLAAILVLPIALPTDWTPPVEGSPVPWLLGLMTVSVALPFFVVSAASPLIQKWFSVIGHKHSRDPYFLYAASNFGSMMALLSYPILIEPVMTLEQQSLLWAIGYGVFIVLIFLAILFLWRSRYEANVINISSMSIRGSQSAQPQTSGTSRITTLRDLIVRRSHQKEGAGNELSLRKRMRWVLLAFVPSSLMVSVTTYLTTDIATVPLLWIIPLTIYLLTFILVFAKRTIISHPLMVKTLPILLLPLVVLLVTRGTDPIVVVIPLHLTAFFVIAMVCHGELAGSRPAASHLTAFYLYLSMGGVLGGAFNAIVAPLVFNSIAEYPIVLCLACLLLPYRVSEPWSSSSRVLDVVLPAVMGLVTLALVLGIQALDLLEGPLAIGLMFGVPVIISFSFSRRPLRFAMAVAAISIAGQFFIGSQGRVLYAERSFYGLTNITLDASEQYIQIMHGTTLHGSQRRDQNRRLEPVAYYHKDGPLGQVFEVLGASKPFQNIAVIGLGAGGISSYARSGQNWTYYEIDPVVARVARDSRYFTFLRDCPARIKIELGDGRLSIAKAPNGAFDLLILDAYSSDAVPVHLLTLEALRLYFEKLVPHGIMVCHISNRYLDLEPILGNLAQAEGFYSLARSDNILSEAEVADGKTASKYLLVSRSQDALSAFSGEQGWKPAKTRTNLGLWTDSYSSIIKILRWRH